MKLKGQKGSLNYKNKGHDLNKVDTKDLCKNHGGKYICINYYNNSKGKE